MFGLELVEHGVDLVLLVAGRVLVAQLVVGQPRFVILKFLLHFVEVHVHVVLLRVLVPEVQLDPVVVALLELLLQLALVVVEVFVEVGQIFVGHFELVHAVPKNYTARCFLIQTAVVGVAGLGVDDVEFEVVLDGPPLRVHVDVLEHFIN